MTDKITLATVSELQAFPSSAAAINSNSAIITAAIDNTLSRDGTSPNQMKANLDMNSFQIINLPAPASSQSPLRLAELEEFIGGGTISTLPSGGTTGQVLTKTSDQDFVVDWDDSVTSVGLAMPADFTITNSPVVSSGNLTANWTTTPTGTGAIVRANTPSLLTPTFIAPALGTPASGVATNLTGTAAGLTAGHVTTNANLTGDVTSSGNATTLATVNSNTGSFGSGTLTPVITVNGKGLITAVTTTAPTPSVTNVSGTGAGITNFLVTPSSANLRTALTDETGTGALVFAGGAIGAATATSINGSTVSPGHYSGEPSNGSAVAGEIGELISSSIALTNLTTTATPQNMTSITLTPGDWDITAGMTASGSGTPTVTDVWGSISATSATPTNTAGQAFRMRGFSVSDPSVSGGIGPLRVSISTNTTYFFVAQASWTTGTFGFTVNLRARRVR